jgi:hypothetical protein
MAKLLQSSDPTTRHRPHVIVSHMSTSAFMMKRDVRKTVCQFFCGSIELDQKQCFEFHTGIEFLMGVRLI